MSDGWQFHVDGRAAGPVRITRFEAMQDAVNAVYADWASKDHSSIKMDPSGGGSIERADYPQPSSPSDRKSDVHD